MDDFMYDDLGADDSLLDMVDQEIDEYDGAEDDLLGGDGISDSDAIDIVMQYDDSGKPDDPNQPVDNT